MGAILRSSSGNFLNSSTSFCSGSHATYILHTFFPATLSEFASLMMTFAVFGSGFLMCPLGAIVLGAYIDKVGRRKGLIVTLSIMAAGTVLIALVPEQHQYRRCDADAGVARHQRDQHRAGSHDRQRHDQSLAPAHLVDVRPQHDSAHGRIRNPEPNTAKVIISEANSLVAGKNVCEM